MGHGKPGKSWNLTISYSKPGKSWNLIVGHGKSWKIIVMYRRLITAVQMSKQGQNKKKQVMIQFQLHTFWWMPEVVNLFKFSGSNQMLSNEMNM